MGWGVVDVGVSTGVDVKVCVGVGVVIGAGLVVGVVVAGVMDGMTTACAEVVGAGAVEERVLGVI